MLNTNEKKKLTIKLIFVVFISFALLSIMRVLLLHQGVLESQAIYILAIKEMLFSLVSTMFIISIVYFTMFKDIKLINKKARSYAFRDALTGLHNRRYLDDFLKNFSTVSKKDTQFAILFIDIDDFKSVNDKKGHITGDCVLKCISDVLRILVRPEDILCRYGGEEFVIILNAISKENALLKASQIREIIQERVFRCKHEKITVSIGISFANYNDDINEVMDEADKALYIAKNAGKNCIKIFDPLDEI